MTLLLAIVGWFVALALLMLFIITDAQKARHVIARIQSMRERERIWNALDCSRDCKVEYVLSEIEHLKEQASAEMGEYEARAISFRME